MYVYIYMHECTEILACLHLTSAHLLCVCLNARRKQETDRERHFPLSAPHIQQHTNSSKLLRCNYT